MANRTLHSDAAHRLLFAAGGLGILLALSPSLTAQTLLAVPTLDSATAATSSTPSTTDIASTELPDAPLPQQQQPLPMSSSLQQSQPQGEPSLSDLGLAPTQTKADADLQARLDRRTRMLKIHQELGLLTTIPILAACISGAGAVPDRNDYHSTTSRDVHVGIAGAGIGMYGAVAYYAIRAPRIPGEGPARGSIRLHKYLIWIHAPGMILTPILGTMAFNDIASGHKPTGLAQYHQAAAVTTAVAYGASILAVSWPIHLHF